MACSASATETQYATITSTSLVTTFSASVETLSSSLSTVLSSSCISSVSGICAATTIITEVDTIPGAISTVQLPVVVANVVIEAIPTLTLFASCSSIQSTEAGPTSPIVTDSSSASFITASTTTPPPTALTTQPSSSAAYVYTSTPAADSEPTPQRSNTSGSSSNLAPILGGVLGGFFFLIVVVVLIWIIYRKATRPVESDDEDVIPYPVMRVRDRRRELDLTNEPKPYEYGLVGHTSSGILTSTPPSTPPASTSLNHHSRSSTFLHSRADSTTPLMYPIGPGPSSPPPDILMQGSDYGHRQRRSSGADIWNTRPASIHTTSGNNVQRLSRNSASRLSLTMPADHLGPIGDGILGGGSSRSLAVLLPSSPEGRELQVVNAPLSPSSVHSPPPGLQRTSPRAGPSSLPSGGSSTPPPGRQDKSLRRARRASSSSSVIVHTDAGRVLDDRVSLSGSILGASGPVLSTVVDDPPPPAYAA